MMRLCSVSCYFGGRTFLETGPDGLQKGGEPFGQRMILSGAILQTEDFGKFPPRRSGGLWCWLERWSVRQSVWYVEGQ